jgi:hypothetical protein
MPIYKISWTVNAEFVAFVDADDADEAYDMFVDPEWQGDVRTTGKCEMVDGSLRVRIVTNDEAKAVTAE